MPENNNAERNSALTPVSAVTGEKQASEATWPKASVVIGNPPFLGDKKMRAELGDAYTEVLRKTYEGRVPGGADLVCYWFEKARKAIETNGLGAAGLVATNSIRGGKNRAVLDAITKTTRIYEAWSDEGWVNEGAAVRVSLIAFGGSTQPIQLNGTEVTHITADLTTNSGANDPARDLTKASSINSPGIAIVGTQKGGSFDVAREKAIHWLMQPNINSLTNALVVRPWVNGLDLVRRPSETWVIDFGASMPEAEAAHFELPFAHVVATVKPERINNNRESYRRLWWLHAEPRAVLRAPLEQISRYCVTPRISKYRIFVWKQSIVLPDTAVVAIFRSDDTTFGILHSRFHELWSLRMGTSLEDRPRYTPTTCFETFPFPAGLTPADTAHQRTESVAGGALIPTGLPGQVAGPHPSLLPEGEGVIRAGLPGQRLEAGAGRRSGAILKSEAYEPPASAPPPPGQRKQTTNAGPHPRPLPEGEGAGEGDLRAAATNIAIAAKKLNDLREAWLNPPEWTQRVPEVVPLGMDRSPYPDRIVAKHGFEKELAERTLTKLYNQRPAWLSAAHQALDAAVAAAYGWTDYTPAMPDEEILKRLLALNLARAA